jgi:putative SOS response-associated peptidase YedK
MCGRYTQNAELSEVALELNVQRLELMREWQPKLNIAPAYGAGSEQPFVLRGKDDRRVLRLGRWWFIPHFWQKPLKELPAAFNARAEDLASKPYWREALSGRRCLVPATGWREFTGPRGKKQPFQFELSRKLFAFAGLWSRWRSPEGEWIDSYAIITTAPNVAAAEIHDRMPLVLPKELEDAWLDPDVDPMEVLAAARARSEALVLDVYPVDPIGNDARVEDPRVVERIPLSQARSLPGEPKGDQGSLFELRERTAAPRAERKAAKPRKRRSRAP